MGPILAHSCRLFKRLKTRLLLQSPLRYVHALIMERRGEEPGGKGKSCVEGGKLIVCLSM